jgi:hypothetical protein
LDVLRADVRRNAAKLPPDSLSAWLRKIEAERRIRIAEVVAKTTGEGSLLYTWRSNLEIAHMLSPTPQLGRRSA